MIRIDKSNNIDKNNIIKIKNIKFQMYTINFKKPGKKMSIYYIGNFATECHLIKFALQFIIIILSIIKTQDFNSNTIVQNK